MSEVESNTLVVRMVNDYPKLSETKIEIKRQLAKKSLPLPRVVDPYWCPPLKTFSSTEADRPMEFVCFYFS